MDMGLAPATRWAWQEMNISLSELILCLASGLDSCALPNSLVTLSALKLRLVSDARWAQMVRWARLLLYAIQDFASFKPEIMQILLLNHMGDPL